MTSRIKQWYANVKVGFLLNTEFARLEHSMFLVTQDRLQNLNNDEEYWQVAPVVAVLFSYYNTDSHSNIRVLQLCLGYLSDNSANSEFATLLLEDFRLIAQKVGAVSLNLQ